MAGVRLFRKRDHWAVCASPAGFGVLRANNHSKSEGEITPRTTSLGEDHPSSPIEDDSTRSNLSVVHSPNDERESAEKTTG